MISWRSKVRRMAPKRRSNGFNIREDERPFEMILIQI